MKVKKNFEYVNCNLCGSNDLRSYLKGEIWYIKRRVYLQLLNAINVI